MRRPLEIGGAVGYWRYGPVIETRYDLPDQPMAGEMDPFFFLTRTKNFIPHEYPCRTRFAAERRDRRPQPGATPAEMRLWLPFASPRLDLSGFWFRPTVIGCWAETVIEATTGGPAELGLRTCGGAVLFVNDQEAGWLAPYLRNFESSARFNVVLEPGPNRVAIWFDDLAERDARFYVQLDYLSGPPAAIALPVALEPAAADAMEAALDGMHFDRPCFSEGAVALAAPPLPVDVAVTIRVAGDFSSAGEPRLFPRSLPAGSTRLSIADVKDLPSDFLSFEVTLTRGKHEVRRRFETEICHSRRQGPAPETLAARIDEALGDVAHHGQPGVVPGLARLALGIGGGETDAMIERALPPIEDCHDCADFHLVPLLWCRAGYGSELAPALRDRIDEAVLGFRYWMDEPGDDVQWYFSENHALLFHTAAYLAGHLYPEARFRRSGRTGRDQSRVGRERLLAWLDHFERWEMAEFNSAPYFPIDLKGLCTLFALAPDANIAARAGAAIRRLIEIVARSAHHGVLTAAQGRSYEHSLHPARTLELTGIARLLWGLGNYGATVHALPLLAICLRDHGLDLPESLGEIASAQPGAEWEWCFAQGHDRFARLYHCKSHAFAMGSAAGYRWGEWGYQETVLHLRLGDNPDAQIWINHPGELIQGGFGRPSFWGGSGTLPRVHQYRGLAVVRFDCAEEQPDFTHAWFPENAFDEVRITESAAFASSGRGQVMLKSDGPLQRVTQGPSAGSELRAAGRRRTWLVRVAEASVSGGLETFAVAMAGLSVETGSDGALVVEDPVYGTVRFGADAVVEAEGRRLDPAAWTIAGEAQRLDDGTARNLAE